MKKNRLIIIVSLIITFSILFFIYYQADFIQNEGFNPSDEGVVAAQSFRLINGQVPHKDFVAIRPVFSGVLHTIHFISPVPLIESGRWFVLFENFIISLFFCLILHNLYFRKSLLKISLPFLSMIGLFTFLLNVNIYTFFPWTTVDAILFSIVGLHFVIKAIIKDSTKISLSLFSTGLVFMSIAALCRQTFILLPLVLSLITLFIELKYKKRITWLFLTYLTGFSPILIYLIYLLFHGAIPQFLDQISGRSELIQTGFLAYIKYLSGSYLIPAFVSIPLIIMVRRIISRTWMQSAQFINAVYLFLAVISITLSITIFYLDYSTFFTIPFNLFFISLFISAFSILFETNKLSELIFIISVLSVGWLSSISLGDNAPIFSTGILSGFILVISLNKLAKIKPWLSYLLLLPVLFACYLSVEKQSINNYRDLDKENLKYNLGETFKGFGNIRTNKNTYLYFKELQKISIQMHAEKKCFAIVPNNAAFYPVSGTKNELPLDWMQGPEYIGNEKYVLKKVRNALIQKLDYIIIEKINSKTMQYEIQLLDTSANNYDYMPLIYRYFKKTSYQGDFFIIMQKQPLN